MVPTVCRYFRKATGVLGGRVVPVVRLLGAAEGLGGAVVVEVRWTGDSQIQPKKEVHRHESTWSIMKKSKDRGIFS